jgi:hypothetical protein
MFSGFVKIAIMLNSKRIKYGIQALEEEVEDLDDEDFKMGLRMIIDEVDPGIIDEILSNKLSFEKNKYRRMYKTILKRTVMGIQEGLSNRILCFLLFSLADLTPKEQNKIEWEIFNMPDDPPDETPDEPIQVDEKDITAKYDFTSLRQWTMAIEDIQYATGDKNPKGVLFGNRSNQTIIITKDCPNPDRIIKIITGEGKNAETSGDLDLDESFFCEVQNEKTFGPVSNRNDMHIGTFGANQCSGTGKHG